LEQKKQPGKVEMTEEQPRSMSEQDIRARFRCAPAYYLDAKLEKMQAQRQSENRAAAEAESRWEAVVTEQAQWQAALPEPTTTLAPDTGSVNLSLPGLDVLDAALAASEPEPATPAENTRTEAEITQQAILEAALEDYSYWPVLSDRDAESESAPEQDAESDLARKLTLVLDSEPDLDLLLDAGSASQPSANLPRERLATGEPMFELEFELELILDSAPELEMALESEPSVEFSGDNVTQADFGRRAPRTVPVVSVVMDQKRPNMVRVVGKSTRLAS
jgi:hypothetical protein